MKQTTVSLLVLLLFAVAPAAYCQRSLESPKASASWTQVEWNPNRDGGYGIPFVEPFLKPDVTYVLDIPSICRLTPGEGSASIRTADSKGELAVHLAYYGDRNFRSKMYTTTGYNATFPNIHGFNWLDARAECEYQMKIYCHENESKYMKLLSTSVTPQKTKGGVSFWRADAKFQYNTAVDRKVHSQCFMVSDDGPNLTFESNPSTEYIVASLRKK